MQGTKAAYGLFTITHSHSSVKSLSAFQYIHRICKMKFVPVATILFLLASVGVAAEDEASCYNSTASILQAQLTDPTTKVFKICPATTITIGLPTNFEFTEFAGGDIPLTVIYDDVTIQCGENGDPADDCRLSGGFIQFVTIPNNPFVSDRNVSTNNLLLKGLTFTGEMTEVPGLLGGPVYLSAPGTGMVIEDCYFKDLSGGGGVTAVTNSLAVITPAELYPPFSSELTIKGCSFQNVVYGRGVVVNYNQTMSLEGAIFNEMKYQDVGPGTYGLVANIGGVMELSESTFEASEVVSAVAYWWDISPTDVVSTFEYRNNENSDIVFVNATGREDYCEEGLLKVNHNKSVFGDCVDLFGQSGDSSSAPRFAVAAALILSVGSIFLGVV